MPTSWHFVSPKTIGGFAAGASSPRHFDRPEAHPLQQGLPDTDIYATNL